MPIQAPHLKDSYWQPLEGQLRQEFYNKFFKHLFAVVNQPLEMINSKNDLIAAVNSGRIGWDGKYYRGTLNSRISAELRKIAEWDGRARAFRGIPPSWLQSVLVVSTTQSKKMIAALSRAIELLDIPKIIDDITDSIDFIPIVRSISEDLSAGLGVTPEYGSSTVRKMINKDFAQNISRSIKDFSPKQV
jgi:hypothetical protein